MTFQERYQYNPKTDLIGKGGFARVYKAKDVLLDRDVAIKVFTAGSQEKYNVVEEIKKVIKLKHPSLLAYYDVAVIENTNAIGESETLQIGVMELANAGDLKQFAKNNPGSPMLFTFLQQVLGGLEYLHQKGIIHRDLKPQNILLVEEDGVLTAKISDFGISKSVDSGTSSSSMAIGTIEYMAPEQFNPDKYGINGRIGTNVDLWSFGIMMYELLTNEPVFGQRNGNTTAEQIMASILSAEAPRDIEKLPQPYRDAVKRCLIRDSKERIQKANEIIGILQGAAPATQSTGNETIVLPKMKTANETMAINFADVATRPINIPGKNEEQKAGKRWPFWKTFIVTGLCLLVPGLLLVWLAFVFNSGVPAAIAIFLYLPLLLATIVVFIVQLIKHKSKVLQKKWGRITISAFLDYIMLAIAIFIYAGIYSLNDIRESEKLAFMHLKAAPAAANFDEFQSAQDWCEAFYSDVNHFYLGNYNKDSADLLLKPFYSNMKAVDSIRKVLSANKTFSMQSIQDTVSAGYGQKYLDFFSAKAIPVTDEYYTDNLLFIAKTNLVKKDTVHNQILNLFTQTPIASANGYKFGVVNKSGVTVLPFQYDVLQVASLSRGRVILFAGEFGKGWTIFSFDNDNPNPVRLAEALDYVSIMQDSAKNTLQYLITRKNNVWHFLDEYSGQFVGGEYGWLGYEGPMRHNLLAAQKTDGKAGFLGTTLDPVVPFIYDNLYSLNEVTYYNPLLCVQKDNKWGFINTKGEEAIPFRYDSIKYWGSETRYAEGVGDVLDSTKFAGVYAGGRYFVIDINGHEH